MRQKPETRHTASKRLVKDIQRKARKQYGAEEKIRIVLDGLRGEDCSPSTPMGLINGFA